MPPGGPESAEFGVRDFIPLSEEPQDLDAGFGSVWINSELAVLRVNPDSLDVERIDTSITGNAIAVGGDSVWAAASNDGRVLRIDPLTNKQSVIKLPADPRLPTVFGMAASETAVWLTDLQRPRLRTIDPVSNAPGAYITLSVQDEQIVLGGTWDVAVSEQEGLWISGGPSGRVFRQGQLGRITNQVVALTNRERPNRIAVGHGRAWVQMEGSSDLLLIDASDESYDVLMLDPENRIIDIAVSADAVWLAQQRTSDGLVSRLDPDTLEITHSVRVQPISNGSSLAVLGESVWVAHRLERVLTVIERRG
jgi:streptogramin lyase